MLYEYFNEITKSNRISHAFLICNTNYDNLKDELNKIFSDYFFNGNKIDENSLDILLIKPNNNVIKKEEILEIQEKFKTKSLYNNNRIYVIDNAEKMNAYAANSLLKFLEEPEGDIYAFLITQNINKVYETIKSRCQVINITSDIDFEIKLYDDEIIEKSINLVNLIEEKGINSEAYIYDIINKKEEKETIIDLMKIIKYFYRDILNYKIYGKTKYFDKYKNLIETISSKIDDKLIVNKLIVINKLENMLEYNVNINLFIDRLIIELERIK